VTAFPADAQLYAQFDDPVLPVDTKIQEEVWDMRIAGLRGTEVDYFMQVNGLSREEATEKFLEVIAFNKQKTELVGPPPAATKDSTDAAPTPSQDDK
jgi:hypothetical protein